MESAESARVWNRGACVFPRALCKWIGLHVVEMEALLHLSPNSWGHWKTCSVEIWGQLMSMTHCDNNACVWLTFPHIGHWIDHQGELLFVFSVCDNVVQVQEVWRYRHGTNFRPGSYGCPTIGEAEVSSYNSMSACKSTFESSGVGVQFDAHDMVWTAWNAKWARQEEPFEVIHLGVEAFLWFGSYVMGYVPDIIWEYVVTGYLCVLRLYNDDMKWEWNCSDLLICNQNSFWCDSIIWFDVEY